MQLGPCSLITAVANACSVSPLPPLKPWRVYANQTFRKRITNQHRSLSVFFLFFYAYTKSRYKLNITYSFSSKNVEFSTSSSALVLRRGRLGRILTVLGCFVPFLLYFILFYLLSLLRRQKDVHGIRQTEIDGCCPGTGRLFLRVND